MNAFFCTFAAYITRNQNEKKMNNTMLPVGAVLRRTYRIDKQLASGGFGNTYAVTNLAFNERLAIKEFFIKGINEREADNTSVSVSNGDNRSQFDEQLEKFRKEARRLRQLHNQHIVRVHDLFEENGTCYYVMDYVDGVSLSERLKHDGPLPEHEVLDILAQMLDALEEVHRNHLWHLDLKPANIMVNRQGSVQLIDFGASKQFSQEGGATTSTALCYTPGFAPPEQVEQNMEKFGPWTDIYALGATLFNLLTNQRPPQVSDINESPQQAFKPLAHISKQMQDLIRWMMQPNRQQRPQSVAALRSRLKRIEETPKAAPASIATKVAAPKPARPLKTAAKPQAVNKPRAEKKNYFAYIAGGLLIGLVLLALVGGGAYWLLGKEKTQAQEVEEYRAYHDLPTELDSLAYAMGMAQSDGLKEYLANSMDVDTTYMAEFVQGLLQGSTLTSTAPQPMTGEALNAYNAGIQIGSQVNNQMIKNVNYQLFGENSTQTFPVKIFVAGLIQGVMGDTSFMTIQEAGDIAQDLFERVKSKAAEEKYGKNKADNERFLVENAKKEGVVTLPSGLQYKVLKEGNGSIPTKTDLVVVHYTGQLIDGTVFDSSYNRDEPTTLRLNQVIEGWTEALTMMPVGSIWEVYIPQELGYGNRESGSIPPYSTLIFKIELLEVK